MCAEYEALKLYYSGCQPDFNGGAVLLEIYFQENRSWPRNTAI